jgi:hypothetical protein
VAEGKFYLRPSEDISVEHDMRPSGSTSAYLLLNEEVSDEAGTYIKSGVHRSAHTETSSFKFSGVVPNEEIRITELNFVANGHRFESDMRNFCTVTIGEQSVSKTISFDTAYSSDYSDVSELVDSLNDYIKANGAGSFPEVIASVTTDTESQPDDLKQQYPYTCFSQLYIEVTYKTVTGLGIYRKSGGAVKAATAAYRKLGGSWVEITEEEAKGVLKNNIITQGGS